MASKTSKMQLPESSTVLLDDFLDEDEEEAQAEAGGEEDETMEGEEEGSEEYESEVSTEEGESEIQKVPEEEMSDKSRDSSVTSEEKEEEAKIEEEIEEEQFEEELEPPPDPSAPYNLTDSSEALKAPFELRADQMKELVELWEMFQDYTPAYTDIDDYITEKELIYMLNSLNLMTFTPEQMQELVAFCVRPPDPDGHINFQQFVHMITIRQRDMPIEEEIRIALEALDYEKAGILDREYVREIVGEHGNRMKGVDNFIKEVDMANDGTLGIEDIVGTICLDLNKDDINILLEQINPPEADKSSKIDAALKL